MFRVKLVVVIAALAASLAASGCGSSEERIAEHRARANEYFEAEQWAEAKIEFLNLLDLDPDDAEAHYKMGQVLFNLQDPRDGLWQYREAVRLAPENNEWRLALAQVLFIFRSYEEALDHVNQILEVEPDNVDALLLRAGVRNVQGENDAMLEDVDRALEVDPKHHNALAVKAQALAQKGDAAGAEEFLRRLIEVAPTAENYTTLARFFSRLGRRDEALSMSQKAVEVAEDEEEGVRAYLNLANQQLNRGEVEETFAVLARAREAYPGAEQILLTLARLHQANGERDKAEEILEQYAEGRPDDPAPLLVLADYYRALNETDRAIAAIDRALAPRPRARDRAGAARRVPALRQHRGVGAQGGLGHRRERAAAQSQELGGALHRGQVPPRGGALRGVRGQPPARARRAAQHQRATSCWARPTTRWAQTDLARSEYQQAVQTDAPERQRPALPGGACTSTRARTSWPCARPSWRCVCARQTRVSGWCWPRRSCA